MKKRETKKWIKDKLRKEKEKSSRKEKQINELRTTDGKEKKKLEKKKRNIEIS